MILFEGEVKSKNRQICMLFIVLHGATYLFGLFCRSLLFSHPYPLQVVPRGWMEELLTHVIVESFAHGETLGSLRMYYFRENAKKIDTKTRRLVNWNLSRFHWFEFDPPNVSLISSTLKVQID